MADDRYLDVPADVLRAVSTFLSLWRIDARGNDRGAGLSSGPRMTDGPSPEMKARTCHRLIDSLQVDEAALAELAESFDEVRMATEMREREGATVQ